MRFHYTGIISLFLRHATFVDGILIYLEYLSGISIFYADELLEALARDVIQHSDASYLDQLSSPEAAKLAGILLHEAIGHGLEGSSLRVVAIDLWAARSFGHTVEPVENTICQHPWIEGEGKNGRTDRLHQK